jgi:hypothetical protein
MVLLIKPPALVYQGSLGMVQHVFRFATSISIWFKHIAISTAHFLVIQMVN